MSTNVWKHLTLGAVLGIYLSAGALGYYLHKTVDDPDAWLEDVKPYGPEEYPQCQLHMSARQLLNMTGHLSYSPTNSPITTPEWDKAMLSWPWVCAELVKRRDAVCTAKPEECP